MRDLDHARILVRAAENDLSATKGMLNAEIFVDDVFGFHIQQAVEKLLKAWIAARSEEYKPTHNLNVLISKLESMGEDMEVLWQLADLNDFAVEFRYEPLDIGTNQLDRQDLIEKVQALYDRVLEVIEEIERQG